MRSAFLVLCAIAALSAGCSVKDYYPCSSTKLDPTDVDCSWFYCKRHPDESACHELADSGIWGDAGMPWNDMDGGHPSDGSCDNCPTDGSLDGTIVGGPCDGDEDCTDAGLGVCRDDGRCVECTETKAGACDDAAPACVNNQCRQCETNLQCPAETPVCNGGACNECTAKADCAGRAATPVCGSQGACVACSAADDDLCTPQGQVCLSGGNECVQCNVHGDCTDASKPICDNHVCRSCESDSDCQPLNKVCDEADGPFKGQCVQCTQEVADESRCGTKSCDPATRACTQTDRASVGICEACVADSECEADHRCIAMTFQGTPLAPVGQGGGYCLKRTVAGPCDLPYGAMPITRDSLSKGGSDSYCGLNEAKATCDAILLYSRPCSSCEGVPGSLCQAVGAIGNRCTYACGSGAINECPENATCPSGTDSYCGKP